MKAKEQEFKHTEQEWFTKTHHHWIENFRDEDTGKLLPIERKKPIKEYKIRDLSVADILSGCIIFRDAHGKTIRLDGVEDNNGVIVGITYQPMFDQSVGPDAIMTRKSLYHIREDMVFYKRKTAFNYLTGCEPFKMESK